MAHTDCEPGAWYNGKKCGYIDPDITVDGEEHPDITVYGEEEGRSTVFIFTPRTAAGREWIAANVAPGATWFGAGIAVENRYAGELAEGMIADGLVVR